MPCSDNTNPHKLIREGTSQDGRTLRALNPASAPVNERLPEHNLVFAREYAQFLRYYDPTNEASGNWQEFFARDLSVQLAIVSVEDVDAYKKAIQKHLRFLNNRGNLADTDGLKNALGILFSSAGSMARYLDTFRATLPPEMPLKATLRNLIRGQLAGLFKRLIAYYRADEAGPSQAPARDRVIKDLRPDLRILGQQGVEFKAVLAEGLSPDWSGDVAWASYQEGILADEKVFGTGTSVFERTNAIATHNLFTAVFDGLLKTYARLVADAKAALTDSFTKQDSHEPHYALFLAFLRLLEQVRQETNTLTQRHLDFYYRDILRLREKPAQPGHAHLILELAKHVETHLLDEGSLVKAGKDATNKPAFFESDRPVVLNRAVVKALKTVYRHGSERVDGASRAGWLWASPVANSADGLGAELETADKSWHPFFNKTYVNGVLRAITMPLAEVGFAVASHYLFLAEGTRTITLTAPLQNYRGEIDINRTAAVRCLLTTAEGWLELTPKQFIVDRTRTLQLKLILNGDVPPLTPYVRKTHGYTFDTNLPILLIKFVQAVSQPEPYTSLQEATLGSLTLAVDVSGLRTLAVSNDFGPVDVSKPFQPFGAQPNKGSSLTIGSTELFQKRVTSASLSVMWQVEPMAYKNAPLSLQPFALQGGNWTPQGTPISLPATQFNLSTGVLAGVVDDPDPAENRPYEVSARHGFVRLNLSAGLGQAQYQTDLQNFLIDKSRNPAPKIPTPNPGNPPTVPLIAALSFSYGATQTVRLGGERADSARFFHLTLFGTAEQHAYRKQSSLIADKAIYLLPPFRHRNTTDDARPLDLPINHEAEFYIGVSQLQPPQPLTLLFQVADGTADPQAQKPSPHLHWSYLYNDEWIPFAKEGVDDGTAGLIRSGIVTLNFPREASQENTLLEKGLYWIRVAVETMSEAVCRLIQVSAQAVRTTFADRNNDPAFLANVLPPGTISKLDRPNAAIKRVNQPFATFGGRGAETGDAFYTRVSERLRHKDRAVTLWDYEHLVLEAFPQIYKVKCLNHTRYEPGIYRELAPGHVTFITIPNGQFQNLRNPLQPFTSLGLLDEVADFLRERLPGFVRLHVRNPEFEMVRVAFRVRFFPSFDQTFYTKKLQEAITRFLSPWAFTGGGGPSFGGKIHKSVLVNFVEEQPYVDYVTDFALFHQPTGTTDLDEVTGSKAISILVSAPADQHLITVLKPIETESTPETCHCAP